MTDAVVQKLMHANLLEVFGEPDANTRLEVIRRTYTDDVVFADPHGEARGHEALNAKAQEVRDGAGPDFVFAPDGEVRQVQDLGYLAWTFGPGGAPVVRGVDIGIVRDGLLAKVYTVLVD